MGLSTMRHESDIGILPELWQEEGTSTCGAVDLPFLQNAADRTPLREVRITRDAARWRFGGTFWDFLRF